MLRVNSARQATVLSGTPLTFSVFLSGAKNSPSWRIGTTGHDWVAHLYLQSVDTNRRLDWPLVQLGTPRQFSRAARGSGQFTPQTWDKPVASQDVLYRVNLAIDPQQASKIPAGQHKVVAVLHVPFWPPWNWSGHVFSRPVTVQVLAQSSVPVSTDLEEERLIASVEFYLDAHRFQEAYENASQLKEREPDSIDSYILLGDALSGLRRDQEALETYDYALDLAAQQNVYEPPEYLLIRKHQLEQRLQQQH